MKKFILSLVIILMCSFCLADWVDHPVGLAVWIPDEWGQEKAEDLLQVTSPDDAATVIYMIIDAENLDVAVDKLEKELSGIMKRVKVVREVEAVEVNGIPGVITSGTGYLPGKIKEIKARWLVGILQYRDKALMVVGFAAEALFDDHEEELEEMLTSIKNLWLQHPIGLEVWVHPEWLTDPEEDGLLVLSPDEEVVINYHIINVNKLTKALNVMEVELKKTLSFIEAVNEPEEFLLNDIPGVITSGKANVKGMIGRGDPVRWMVAILFYKNKALMISGLVPEDMYEEYEADIRKILTSIRSIE